MKTTVYALVVLFISLLVMAVAMGDFTLSFPKVQCTRVPGRYMEFGDFTCELK